MDQTETQNLCCALNVVLDPTVDNSARLEAIKLCESYKNNNKSVEIGFYLVRLNSLPYNVRYFGLQLIKHKVRLQWTDLQRHEQVVIQSEILSTVSSFSSSEPAYMKSLLASILTEIVKQVWPQQWPTMQIDVIEGCAARGNLVEIEIVVMMLLSLAEDVILYPNISSKSRSRDLRQALFLESSKLMAFFVEILKQQMWFVTGGTPISELHKQVAGIILQAIGCYAEWVTIGHLFTDDEVLIDTLLHLFQSESLQVQACECLLSITGRKGPLEERKIILNLVDDSHVIHYVTAIKIASQAIDFNKTRFHFLHSIGKVVSNLTGLIVSLWVDNNAKSEGCPNELFKYREFMEVLFYLTSHDSKYIAQTVLPSWCNLLRLKVIRKDPILCKLIPLLLDIISKHLCKDYKTHNDFSKYEDLQFNGQQEKLDFMKRFRGSMIELLRFSTCAFPLAAINACFQYTQAELNKKYDDSETTCFKWEGTLTFIETVTNSVISAAEDRNEKHLLPVMQAEALLQTLLSQETNDASLLKIYLSCANGLCKLVALSVEPVKHFKLLFDHIFSLLDKTAEQRTVPLIGTLRRNACALIVRSSKYFSSVLVPLNDYFKSLVLERMHATPCILSPFEKVSMLESLVLISIECSSISSLTELIRDIMSSTNFVSQSESFQLALENPASFANAIGLFSLIPDLSQDEYQTESTANFRSGIYYYLALTLSMMNRTQSCKQINPCSAHIGMAIDHALLIAQMISAAWSPQIQLLIHPENTKAIQLRECEKLSLLYHNPENINEKSGSEEKIKKHWERLQNFLVLCLDDCYQILGLAGKTLGRPFYNHPNLERVIVNRILCNVEHLPVMRLKSLIRHFIGNFLKHCPLDYIDQIIAPILQTYCQFVMERLHHAWEAYSKKETERLLGSSLGEAEFAEGNKEEEEIVEEQLLRLLTREHLDLLITLFVNKQPPPNPKNVLDSQDDHEDVDMTCLQQNHSNEGQYVFQLTQLGIATANSMACESVLCSALEALSWHDTASCFKSTHLLMPLLKLLLQEHDHMFNEQTTQVIMKAILRGLFQQGQNDGCEAKLVCLALMVISSLHHRFKASIAAIIHNALPNIELGQIEFYLNTFDNMNEKKRKINFKKLTNGLIQHHIGQQFKEVQKMNDFSPLLKNRKKAEKGVGNKEILGLADLFEPVEDTN